MIRAGLIGLSVIIAACTAPAIAPSASPSAIAIVVPSPTPAPPTASPSPTPTRHVNAVLGYAVTLPAPWRVSECQSGIHSNKPFVGQDVLTWRTVAEERDLGGGADAGAFGALTSVVSIAAELSSKTPAEYKATVGGSVDERIETTTIDGKPALHVFVPGGQATYYVANAGRVYSIGLTIGHDPNDRQPPGITATFDAIARSLTFVMPTARPTPTPTPTLSPEVEGVVDAVAAGFAAADADRLRDVMPPKCWFQSASYPGGSSLISGEKMAEILRSAFAKGLKVNVETRPIRSTGPILQSPFQVWSTWSAYGTVPVTPASTVQLTFDRIDGRWYWIGAHYNAPR